MVESPRTAGKGPPAAKRILVMRYRFIGDTILTVPFLRNLRRAYPDAVIDVLVGPQSGSVLAGCPYINELISFDTTRFHKYDSGQGERKSFWHYAANLQKRNYDLVFVLKRSFSSGVLAWLTGARQRVGYDTEFRRFLLTCPVPFDGKRHEVESLLDVLAASAIPVLDDYLEAFVSPAETEEIKTLVPELGGQGPHVLIHAAAAHPAKMYPLASWAHVVARLKNEAGILPYFTGAPADRALYEELETLSGVKAVNLAGRLSLRQSMALYKEMDAALCVDSGPAHLAASTGTPTLALFGPTDPGRWRPWGKEHRAIFDDSLKTCPCQISTPCTERPCLTSLSADLVADAGLALLADRQAEAQGQRAPSLPPGIS